MLLHLSELSASYSCYYSRCNFILNSRCLLLKEHVAVGPMNQCDLVYNTCPKTKDEKTKLATVVYIRMAVTTLRPTYRQTLVSLHPHVFIVLNPIFNSHLVYAFILRIHFSRSASSSIMI